MAVNFTARDHARLAELFVQSRRTLEPGPAMGAALSILARERRDDTSNIDIIVAAVEASVGLNPGELAKRSRKQRVDSRRGMAYWLIYRDGLSVTEIATAIGRSHAAISIALGKFRKQLAASADLRARVAWLHRDVERKAVG
jgi:chromosomal replication initiation ATPase DnaA